MVGILMCFSCERQQGQLCLKGRLYQEAGEEAGAWEEGEVDLNIFIKHS